MPIPLPVILGHETVGRVVALGEGCEQDWRGQPLAKGNRVTWASSIVCGRCYYCRVKRQPTRCVSRKAYGISYCADQPPHLHGGYAEAIALRPGTAIFRLADELPGEAVVGVGCALWTAIHGLERAGVGWGDVVVVLGAGPVGLAAVAVARQAGAGRIIVTDTMEHRLTRAAQFGADQGFVVSTAAEKRQAVLEATPGGYGADLVIECVGRPAAVAAGLSIAATESRCWSSASTEMAGRRRSTPT